MHFIENTSEVKLAEKGLIFFSRTSSTTGGEKHHQQKICLGKTLS